MNNELLESAYKRLTIEKANIIKTGFENFDEILSFCNYGSIITLCGTLNHEFFLNLVKTFSNQNKKCLYFYDSTKHQELLMKLIVLNSVFTKDLLIAKDEIKQWNIILSDNKFNNINTFKDLIEKEKPDYIFIDDLRKFKVKSIKQDDLINVLKILIQENQSIAFIKTGKVLLKELDTDLIDSINLKLLSDVIIASKLCQGDIYSFWVLKDNKLNNDVFSLKYEYQKYLFSDTIG